MPFTLAALDQFDNPAYFVVHLEDNSKSHAVALETLYNVSSTFEPPGQYYELYEKSVSHYYSLTKFLSHFILCLLVFFLLSISVLFISF